MSTKTKAQLLVEIKTLKKRLSNLLMAETESQRKNEISQRPILLEGEDKFQILFNNAPDAYYIADTKGTLIDGNLAAEELTGYKRKELVGSSFLKRGLISADQLPKAAKLILQNKQGRSTGPDEFILTRKDGTNVSVEIRTRPVKIGGEKVVLGIARDVTKRVLAERALRESEEKYQKIYMVSPYSMTITNAKTWKFVDVNDGFEHNTGYTRQEVIGKTALEIGLLKNPEDRQRMYEIIAEKGSLRDFETIFRHKNGSDVISLLSTEVIELDGGTHFVSIGNNIIESKKAERELVDSNLRYQSVFESAFDGFLIMRGEKYIDCNENALNMFQIGREFIIGKHPYDPHLSPEYQPDGQSSKSKAKKLISLAYQDIPQEFEWVHLRGDGSSYFAEIRLNSVEISGEKLLFVAHRDITERKRAEEEIRSLSKFPDENPNPVLRISKEGKILYASRSSEALLNMWGRSIGEIAPLDWKKNITKSFTSSENQIIEALCENRTLSFILAPIKEMGYVNAYGRDITDERKSAREIETLLDLSKKVSSETLDNLVKLLASEIVQLIPNAEASSIWFYEEEKEIYEPVAWDGFRDEVMREFTFQKESGLGGLVRKSLNPMIINNISENNLFIPFDNHKADNSKSVICVPLIFKENFFGLIFVDNLTKTDAFNERDLSLLESVANQLSGVIQNARQFDENLKNRKGLQKSEEQYRSVVEDSPGLICRYLSDGTITFVNREYCKFFGKELDELIGTNMQVTIPKQIRESVWSKITSLTSESPILESENENINNNGETRWMRWFNRALFSEDGKLINYQSFGEDITERKRAKDELIRSEVRYRQLFENAQDGLVIVDMEGIIKAANSAACDMYGYQHKELIGLSANKLVHPDFPQEIETFIQTTGNEEIYISHTMDVRKDGSTFYAEVHGSSYAFEDEQLLLAVIRDITEQKQSQEVLLLEKEKAQKYLDIAGVIMLALNEKGGITLINQKGNQVLGYQEGELIGKSWFEVCIPERIRKEVKQVFRKIIAEDSEQVEYYQNPVLTKSGEERIIAWHNIILRDEKGNPISTLSSGEDITEQVRAEQLLNALNKASVAMTAAHTQKEIFSSIAEELKQLEISCMLFLLDETHSRLFTEYMSYKPTIIYSIEKLIGFTQKDFSFPVDNVDVYRTVVREKKALFSENSDRVIQQVLPKFAKKFSAKIVKMLNVQRGIFAPLLVEDQVIGVFSLQSENLIREDIPAATAFAFELAGSWEKTTLIANLKNTIEGTIHTIAATVEARDPYTSGHQTRVTDLATAIAKEMDLSSDQIEGIQMASTIHDLGKIKVPSEILSKPGKITDLEYEMIKIHPQVGFDLLKDIEFPWPIAKIVLQHHEMMNGTGYPQGLKRDEILLEARILAVADIVEAMSSHRPYRPALGIEKGLDQIMQDRGTLLDSVVVDACLKVFKQGYELTGY